MRLPRSYSTWRRSFLARVHHVVLDRASPTVRCRSSLPDLAGGDFPGQDTLKVVVAFSELSQQPHARLLSTRRLEA